MGSSASVKLDRLESDMDETFLREQLQDQFDPVEFEALQNDKKHVNKDFLLAVHSKGVENEVFKLFKSYSGGAPAMTLEQYTEFFLDAKLLRKTFKRLHAERLFHQAVFDTSENIARKLNYFTFREKIIPEYCTIRGVTEERVLAALADCEGPNHLSYNEVLGIKKPSLNESLYLASSAVAANSGKHIMSTGEPKEAELASTPVEPDEDEDFKEVRERAELKLQRDMAAIKLQKITRGKEARRRIRAMKEVESIRRASLKAVGPPVDAEISALLTSLSPSNAENQYRAAENEVGLQLAFDHFATCGDGEMDVRGFVRFAKDLKFLTRRFTTVDVENIFRKAIAKIQSLAEDDPLKKAVFFNKRINFIAFRSVAVGALAFGRSMTVDDLMGHVLLHYMELKDSTAGKE